MGRHAVDCSARLDSLAMIRTYFALLGVAVWLFLSNAEAAGVSYQFRGVNVVRVGGETHIAGTVGAEAASIPSAGSGSLWHLGTGALWQNGGTQVLGRAAEFVSQHPISSTAGSAIVTAIRSNPGALVTSAVATFLLEKGLEYANGQWQSKVQSVASDACPANGYPTCPPPDGGTTTLVSATRDGNNVACNYYVSGPYWSTGCGFWVNSPPTTTTRTATESDWDAARAAIWPDPALRDLVRNGVSLPTDKPIYNPTTQDIDVSDPYTDPVTGKRYKDKAKVTPSTAEPGKADVTTYKQELDPATDQPKVDPVTGGAVNENSEPKDPCELNPERMGCKEFGTPEDTGDLPGKAVGVSSITPVVFASNASCPADIPLPKGATFSFDWPCRMAEGVKPFLLVLAWLIAGMIVIGVARDNG